MLSLDKNFILFTLAVETLEEEGSEGMLGWKMGKARKYDHLTWDNYRSHELKAFVVIFTDSTQDCLY